MKLIRVTQATAATLLLTAVLAACGGSGDEDTATDAPRTMSFEGDGPRGGQVPGAFGTVAAVEGKTAQVQNEMTGQVAVSWTGDTTFTQEVDATLDDVEVGACVVVSSEDAQPGATEVTATSVRILDECGMPGGMPTDRPTEMSTDMPLPEDAPDGARMGGFGILGEVSAVSADGFTVVANDADVSVTVAGDTTYTTTAEADAAAVEVGVCVNAQGENDDTGALTATSISVSQPVDGQCTGGFMMQGPRP